MEEVNGSNDQNEEKKYFFLLKIIAKLLLNLVLQSHSRMERHHLAGVDVAKKCMC
jgi:hypothetical protein